MAILDKPFNTEELIQAMEEASASSDNTEETSSLNDVINYAEKDTVDESIKINDNDNETNVKEYSSLKDGTDISSIENLNFRKALSTLTAEHLILWHDSNELMWDCYNKRKYGTGCSIMSGDYLFPVDYDGVFFGFILQITEKQYNGTKNWYIDLAIGNDIKTIRCTINAFNDVVKKGIIDSFGKFFEMNDLIYKAVSIRISNKFDENNNVERTNILKFKFLTSQQMDCLDLGYESIFND